MGTHNQFDHQWRPNELMRDLVGTRSAWTPERRAKQAEAIRRWQPWEKATGPRSDAGKAISSRNADKRAAAQNERYRLILSDIRAHMKVCIALMKEERRHQRGREKQGHRDRSR